MLHWDRFITNNRLGTESPLTPPFFHVEAMLADGLDYLEEGSLADYLGLQPIPDADSASWTNRYLNALPFMAYYKVWYDYYRDRNYVADNVLLPANPSVVNANYATFCVLRNRAWRHDYFTSALPWTQRGAEVLMPIEFSVTEAYLTSTGATNNTIGAVTLDNLGNIYNAVPVSIGFRGDNSSASIIDLRQAARLQEWLERNAVAGSRYNESIMAHFARKTSDGRLQRAEYLGGGRVPVQISEVLTTAYSDSVTDIVPPGTFVGRGSSYSSKNSFRYNCEEHGFVIGIMSVMPTPGYVDGSSRMFWSRWTFLDYPWPSFAHLGEQEVYDYEVFQDSATVPANNDQTDPDVFGYQSRYADWKHIRSSCHGDFRTTLDYWHLDRKFVSLPTLGESFVTFEDELQDRIFSVSEVDTLWCYVHNNASVVRSLPYFGTPRL